MRPLLHSKDPPDREPGEMLIGMERHHHAQARRVQTRGMTPSSCTECFRGRQGASITLCFTRHGGLSMTAPAI